jgi:hypothetical protein
LVYYDFTGTFSVAVKYAFYLYNEFQYALRPGEYITEATSYAVINTAKTNNNRMFVWGVDTYMASYGPYPLFWQAPYPIELKVGTESPLLVGTSVTNFISTTGYNHQYIYTDGCSSANYVQPYVSWADKLTCNRTNSVFAMGYNAFGQLGDNTLTESSFYTTVVSSGALSGVNIVAMEATDKYSIVLGSNGLLYGWGYNAN